MEPIDNLISIGAVARNSSGLLLIFIFLHTPDESDLETISLLHTEIAASVWMHFSEIDFNWRVGFEDIKDSTATEEHVIYKKDL